MLTARPQSQSSRRDAWVEVDLGKLEKNVQILKSWLVKPGSMSARDTAGLASQGRRIPPVKFMGVVKADAYGHGAVPVSEVLAACGASWLGVASVDEGVQLREAGQTLPILVLSPAPLIATRAALDYSLDLTVSSLAQLSEITGQLRRLGRKASIHLKVDTGMHRLGVNPDTLETILAEVMGNPLLSLISVYSHLAKPEDEAATTWQNDNFLGVIARVAKTVAEPVFFHLASGEAACLFPFTHHDLVRPGLCLYGLEAARKSPELEPVLSLRARINQVSDIGKGEAVGYGLTWSAERPTRLACLPLGYADGIDRRLSNRMKGLLQGKLVNQVGRISMDQMLFDITDVETAKLGDVLTLIGSEGEAHEKENGTVPPLLTLADWAIALDSITYELAVRLQLRLPRVYTRHSARSFSED